MKKKILALSLSLALCMSLLPTASAAGKSYEEAVKEFQSRDMYETEQSFDSGYGTVFIYNNGPNPRGSHGSLVFIAKAPCAKGAGAVVGLPTPQNSLMCLTKPPLTADLSKDGKTFTYTYHYDSGLITPYDRMLRAAGDFIYTLDLTTGEVTAQEPSIPQDYHTYAAALERAKNQESWTVEQTLEAPACTILLGYFTAEDGRRSYFLDLVYKVDTSSLEEGMVVSHNLTITKNDGSGQPGFPVYHTHRAPDSLTLNEDKTLLTYTYSESLEGGPKGATIDLDTGLTDHFTAPSAEAQPPAAEFSDVPAGSWFGAGVKTCAGKGIMVGTGEDRFSPDAQLTAAECLTLAVRLYDLQRGGDGTLEKAPEDWGYLAFTLADGKTFSRYGEVNPFFDYTRFDNAGPNGRDLYAVYVQAPGDTTEEREAYARAHEGRATLTAQGRDYPGTVTADSTYDGPCLRFTFDCPEAEQPNLSALFDTARPGPDRWYRNAVYTAERLGLREAEGFSTLLSRLATYYPDTNRANREAFAKALAVAAGELEKKYDVPSIPDVERSDYNAGIYSLYEAGILNGQDSFGTFWGEKNLTRAEAAAMVSRVLDPGQRLTTPPAAPNGYDQAVIDLRTSFGYYNEETYEADDCTLFVYDRGGMMNAPSGRMSLIYKPGSQPGDGYVLDLPFVRSGWKVTPADTLDFDPEGGTLTYAYFYETDALDSSLPSGDQIVAPGTVTFTVDLPTGDIRREHRGVDYAGAMAHVTRKRIITSDQHSEDREVVQTIEAPDCTVVLTKGRFYDEADDYILSLVYKPGSALGDGVIKQLLLPTTADLRSWYNSTDRAPDSLFLSAGGTKLVYAYDFPDRLADGETVYHEAGRYIYTVDLKTGELNVDVPIKPDNVGEAYGSYQQALDKLKNGMYPLTVDRQLETETCSLVMGHVTAPHGGYYTLKLVFKPGSQPGEGMVVTLPRPRTDFWDNGRAPTTLEISEDQRLLTYTYHFDTPTEFDGGVLHEAGDYTYTVDLHTGVTAEELLPGSYEEALSRCLQEETYTLAKTLEGPYCTALLRYSHTDENALAHQPEGRRDYELTLIYRSGTALPEGTLRTPGLPYTFSGRTADGLGIYVVSDRAPDTMAFSEDGRQFIYTYQFDTSLLDPMGEPVHQAGTYIYTVDIPTGVTDLKIQ